MLLSTFGSFEITKGNLCPLDDFKVFIGDCLANSKNFFGRAIVVVHEEASFFASTMRQIIPRSVVTRFPKVHLAVERKSRHSVFSNRVFSPGQFVHPADRVKYWNIVPKDSVRILKGRQDIKKDSDGNDVITPVLQVDQFKNRVFPESGLKVGLYHRF